MYPPQPQGAPDQPQGGPSEPNAPAPQSGPPTSPFGAPAAPPQPYSVPDQSPSVPANPYAQPSAPPADPYAQPSAPPADPYAQSSAPPADPYAQSSAPPADPYAQSSAPPADPYAGQQFHAAGQQPYAPAGYDPTSAMQPTGQHMWGAAGPMGQGAQPTSGYPQPTAPARRSLKVPLLIAGAALLAVATIATAAIGFVQAGDLQDKVTALTSENDTAKREEEAAAAELKEKYRSADLPGKLNKVKELDRATDDAFQKWENVAGTKFGVLAQAIVKCNAAVDEYNRAAAPFPAELFDSSVPRKIDTSNRDTDCGRAFTADI